MSPVRLLFLFLTAVTAVSNLYSAEHKYLKAFPQPEEGVARYAVVLPDKQRGEEDAFRVELIVGKTMMTDGVNQYHIGGELNDKPLKGWGFTYYEVKELGPVRQTLIGVPPGTPPVEKFVHGPSKLIRYNSRIPVIVYVPEGAEVRYRVFKAGETKTAEEG